VRDDLVHGVTRLLDHRRWLNAPDRVRKRDPMQVRQASLVRFHAHEAGELVCPDDDGRDAQCFEEDGGVDTPRRAGSSVG
jgi:hypothetical protein